MQPHPLPDLCPSLICVIDLCKSGYIGGSLWSACALARTLNITAAMHFLDFRALSNSEKLAQYCWLSILLRKNTGSLQIPSACVYMRNGSICGSQANSGSSNFVEGGFWTHSEDLEMRFSKIWIIDSLSLSWCGYFVFSFSETFYNNQNIWQNCE